MKQFKRTRQRGQTLIEVMFAVFLLAICALIFAGSMPIANQGRGKADQVNVATSLAQKEAEAVKAMGYSNLTASQLYELDLIDSQTPVATNTYAFSNIDNALVDSPSKSLPSGTGTIKVEDIATELRRVTIVVSWKERGRTRNVTIGTLIANL